ncbi:hypothetical protein [Zhongshania arctica]|uniref:Cellulose biosynthesis protein BcsF n=1 Tax=Zhongshania arctica TaxID=3238302 RepID=A0ABV3TVN0_9GAMM
MDIRSFLLTLVVSLSAGVFIGFTLRDIGRYLLLSFRKHLIKPRFLRPYQATSQAIPQTVQQTIQQTSDEQDSKVEA